MLFPIKCLSFLLLMDCDLTFFFDASGGVISASFSLVGSTTSFDSFPFMKFLIAMGEVEWGGKDSMAKHNSGAYAKACKTAFM